MSKISILYGTESGNSEMAADDISDTLKDAGFDTEICAMEDYEIQNLVNDEKVVLISSTFGEGEFPETTLPFYDALKEIKPDLSKVQFAAFGLGDSTYENYNNAIDSLVNTFCSLGAIQLGHTGKHDAGKGADLSETAINWVQTIF
jgi:MioC protein